MKKLIVIVLFLFAASVSGYTQENSGFGFFTDRDVYVAGENLLAKIYTPGSNDSRIVHLDLVNSFGKRVNGISAEIKNNQADCSLMLPDSLSSGTYLLRTYLKNDESKFKVIREIWISNRFAGLDKTEFINRVEGQTFIQDKKNNHIQIDNIASEYNTRSMFAANIKIDQSLLNDIEGDVLISVAQTDSTYQAKQFTWKSETGKVGLTEKKGIILSGTVFDKNTSEPASGITVYFTIPDSIPGFQYYETLNDGRFYFLLDKYYGQVEAFVQVFEEKSSQRLKIKMDELFAETGSLPKFSQHPIPESFKINSTRNIEAVTFQKVFEQHNLRFSAPPAVTRETYPYYGKPTQIVDPQLFYDLPNFNEISKELLHGVKFRNYNNEPTIQVINSGTHNYFSEKPLILIDGIPIRDLNIIKDMGTPDIDQVDIFQSDRFYGNLRFPGVVAIHTTKADYSRIKESDQLFRSKFETMQIPVVLSEPILPEKTIPDLRQVLYWEPSVKPAESISVNCKTSSVSGDYKIIVRARLKDGSMVYSEKYFEVK